MATLDLPFDQTAIAETAMMVDLIFICAHSLERASCSVQSNKDNELASIAILWYQFDFHIKNKKTTQLLFFVYLL